jgi:transposase-like protein
MLLQMLPSALIQLHTVYTRGLRSLANLTPRPQTSEKIDPSAENARLKSELRRMTEERDLLKKAAKYVACNPE